MPDPETSARPSIDSLLKIMQRLRDPENGCPWDVQQDFASIAPHTIEEAYEVADAIQRNELDDLKDELGDLLFQVAFHSQMASEMGSFSFDDVVDAICEKMIRRHPHVFGDQAKEGAQIEDADSQSVNWEDIKAEERALKDRDRESPMSLMDDVPRGMAELQRAVKLQKRAARAGFDWPSVEPVLDKLNEETQELREAMDAGDRAGMEDELGDVLFVIANLARQLKIDPARALRYGNAKFERRFRLMEQAARVHAIHDGLDTMSLEEMEALWQLIKTDEPATQQS